MGARLWSYLMVCHSLCFSGAANTIWTLCTGKTGLRRNFQQLWKPRVWRCFSSVTGALKCHSIEGAIWNWNISQKPRIPNIKFDKLLPLIIPDGWSFQHILNGTLPKLTMALDWVIINNITVVLESPRDAIFLQILQKLDITNIAW